MTDLIRTISEKNYSKADELIKEAFNDIVDVKIKEKKKMMMAETYGVHVLPSVEKLKRGLTEDDIDENLLKISKKNLKLKSPVQRANTRLEGVSLKNVSRKELSKLDEMEEDTLEEQRIAIVSARVRGGQIQRRKKVSTVPGMTVRAGQLVRMSPAERRRRKLGAKRAALKSRSKKSQALRKRKMSLLKRQRLGL